MYGVSVPVWKTGRNKKRKRKRKDRKIVLKRKRTVRLWQGDRRKEKDKNQKKGQETYPISV